MATTRVKYCVKCGKSSEQVGYRSKGASRCLECDKIVEEDRKAWNRPYHKARYRALKRLSEMYPEDFDALMEKEFRAAKRAAAAAGN